MHEGKHGILDGVDDIDDVFGTNEEHKDEKGEHADEHAKKHEHGKPHKHGGCNCDRT
ncbi:MAG: hypothetical protein AB1407_03670 [Spirochaetota bacterium]